MECTLIAPDTSLYKMEWGAVCLTVKTLLLSFQNQDTRPKHSLTLVDALSIWRKNKSIKYLFMDFVFNVLLTSTIKFECSKSSISANTYLVL